MLKGGLFFAGLVLLVLLLPLTSASVVINEFEQNPTGTDAGNEWVELYNNGQTDINLNGWNLINFDNDTFQLNGTIQANGYLVVTFEKQWLDNPDELVILINSTETIDITLQAEDNSNNEFSWSRCPDGEDTDSSSDWSFTLSTHNSPNNCSQSEQPEEQEELEQDSSNSVLKIESADDKAEWGETLKIEVSIYKGDTSKYAVYAYVENEDDKRVSEKTTIHAKNKYTTYELTVPIQLKPNCDGKYKDDEHKIILEGLDERETEDIEIEGTKSSICGSQTGTSSSSGGLTYDIIPPDNTQTGKEFFTKIKITNTKSEDLALRIWSYVYRYSKCYSEGCREGNAQDVNLKADSSVEIELKNIVKNAEPGDYRFKIKSLKSGLVTPKEFTYDIKLEKATTKETILNGTSLSLTGESLTETLGITGSAGQLVYGKQNEKIKTATFVLLGVTVILLAYLLWKKS